MSQLLQFFAASYRDHPLRFLLIVAFIPRLVAAIFSEGFLMSDDQFLVVEIAEGWAQGSDLENWFVNSYEENESGRGILYPGLHFLLFKALAMMGMDDMQHKMIVVRLLHALYSLLVVLFGFRITAYLSNVKTASKVGLVLALLWMFPVLSVRNLVEMVAIPPLLAATWWLLKAPQTKRPWAWCVGAGIMLEVAFALRYQIALYGIGLGLGLIIQQRWQQVLLLSAGFGVPFLLVHGYAESLYAGVPFGKLIFYLQYNQNHASSYFDMPFWNYIPLIVGVLIPPIGIMLFVGAFRAWKTYLPMYLGMAFFFFFHSLFPNKQERFMFTMLPWFIMLGFIGWEQIENRYAFWKRNPKLVRGSWVFFWVVNSIALVIITPQYTRKAQVEAMSYLYQQGDCRAFVIEDTNRASWPLMPRAYLGKFSRYYYRTKRKQLRHLRGKLQHAGPEHQPNYVLFLQQPNEDLATRVDSMKLVFPELQFDTLIEGSFIDKLHYSLNPIAKKDDIAIYRVPDGSPTILK